MTTYRFFYLYCLVFHLFCATTTAQDIGNRMLFAKTIDAPITENRELPRAATIFFNKTTIRIRIYDPETQQVIATVRGGKKSEKQNRFYMLDSNFVFSKRFSTNPFKKKWSAACAV